MNGGRLFRRASPGFTIIELAIVIAIIGVIIIPLTVMEVMLSERSTEGNARVELIEQANSALDYIGRDLRDASTVEAGQGTIALSYADGRRVSYSRAADNHGTLVRQADPGAQKLALAAYVESFAVEPAGDGLYRVTLNFRRELITNPLVLNQSGIVGRRKK